MSDSFASTNNALFDDNSQKPKGLDSELHEMIEIEKQKMQFNEQMHEFTGMCWKMCMGQPSTKLDSKTEKCISNCVDRFIDASLFITNRYAQQLQKNL